MTMNNCLRWGLLLLLWTWTLGLPAQVLLWDYEDIITDFQQSGANPDLHVDAAGHMHLSYWKETLDRLVYGRRDAQTGVWSFEEIIDAGTYGYKSAIITDAAGAVHIAFLHNDAGQATVKYVTNASGSWVVEEANGGQSVGQYGPDQTFPTYIQASLDIFLQPSGRPAIVYFDGRPGNITLCAGVSLIYVNYQLDLNMVTREADGSWLPYAFDPVPYTGGVTCLNGPDRAGEFCQVLPISGDRYVGLANSLHNHEVLLYTSAPGDVRTWSRQAVDSTSRFFSTVNAQHFAEGFGYIASSMGPNNTLHLAYSVAIHYGYGSALLNRQPMFYTQIALDSLGDTTYSPRHFNFLPQNRMRNFCGITQAGNDTIFLAYYARLTSEVVVARSTNGGLAWVQDTLYQGVVNAPLKLAVQGDSVCVLAYISEKDNLRASWRALSGGPWVHRDVTRTERRGEDISSLVTRQGADDLVEIAYTESFEDRVYLATRSGGTWTHEPIGPGGRGARFTSLVRQAGEPLVAYSRRADSLLVLARQGSGGNWVEETILTDIAVGDLKLVAGPTDLHVLYYDLNEGGLGYAYRPGSGSWTHELVDTSSLIVGQRPDAHLDAAGVLHVAYLDVLNAKLRYGRRSPAGVWTLEDATDAQNYNPTFLSLQIGTDGQPRLAFRNAANNRVLFAQRASSGTWTVEQVDTDPSNLLGAPLRLLLDASDRPWVLYNHATVVNGMRLARRADNGQWVAVSINNNNAEIANDFGFHLVDEDLYIIGRKNELANNGLGLLYAERGIKTWLEPQVVEASFQLAPNPGQAGQYLQVAFDLPQARPVQLAVYNLQGQPVHLWETGTLLGAGTHRWNWRPEGLAPGVYLVQLRTPHYQVTRKWVLTP